MSSPSCTSLRHPTWGAFLSLLLLLLLIALTLLPSPVFGLTSDGVLLLSFKYSILSDPSAALADWNYADSSPCSWNGVMCSGFPLSHDNRSLAASDAGLATVSRVTALVLPGAQLLGPIAPELGLIEHLRHLDLSGNALNGTLPASLLNSSELRVLSLADNGLSGELPELVGRMRSLQVLNLSDNALAGTVPANLTALPNLTTVSLANNYLFGELPGGGFDALEVFDASSNLLNDSLPPDLGVGSLRYLNLSYNRLAGEIPPELGSRIPASATVDLSFNNLTGQIPQAGAFLDQTPMAFSGNPELCGKPLKQLCTIPSTLSNPPNVSGAAASPESKSPPAIAVIPKDPGGDSPGAGSEASGRQGGLKPAVILAIAAGDLAGVGLLFAAFLYVYQVKKKRQQQEKRKEGGGIGLKSIEIGSKETRTPPSPENRGLSCCLRSKHGDGDESDDTSDSSETTEGDEELRTRGKEEGDGKPQAQLGATLVTVDGETKLELETLLKASAYILGATGSSIVYKAVLADGTALAVRRIGESSGIDRLKDFDSQVRAIAKFRHPNLLRLRGYYWGTDEKLIIHDYAPNGSLFNISFSKKLSSSPLQPKWVARVKIARGIARALAYLHEKKCIHGNVKPSNILLGSNMEPLIGDFGLERLFLGDVGYKSSASARLFGSKRSMHSTSSLPDMSQTAGASPCSSSSTPTMAAAPYQAPESLKNLKPNAKWDVYSFGMVLLELMAGRVLSEVELCHWNGSFIAEEKHRVLRMADPTLRAEEAEGREEALLACFKLGFCCCAGAPQKRPSMKEAVQTLERIAPTTSSSSSSLTY